VAAQLQCAKQAFAEEKVWIGEWIKPIDSPHLLAYRPDSQDHVRDIGTGGLSSLKYLRFAFGVASSGGTAQTTGRGKRQMPKFPHNGNPRDALLLHQDRHSDEAKAMRNEAGKLWPAGLAPTHHRAKEMSSI